MSRPVVTSVTLTAGVANLIAHSQTLGAAGPLALVTPTVTLSVPRRVIITSAADDSGLLFTVTGKGRPETNGGAVISETIAGSNGGVAPTTQDFATVTGISSNGATAGAVTAGTSGVASGPWVAFSQYQADFQVSLFGHILSGSPTWQVDYTYDDVFGTWLPPGQPFPIAIPLPTMTGLTGDTDGSIANTTVRAVRLTLTVAGAVQLTVTQQGS